MTIKHNCWSGGQASLQTIRSLGDQWFQCTFHIHEWTTMHSSRMHTARSLIVSHSICWGDMHAMHTPLPCTPPATHAPLPCTPPAMHAPSHAHPSPATYAPCHLCPPAMHTPLPHMPPCHACPLSMWTDRHLWKHNLHKLRLRAVKIHKTSFRYRLNIYGEQSQKKIIWTYFLPNTYT